MNTSPKSPVMNQVSSDALASRSPFASHFLSKYVRPVVSDRDFSDVEYRFHGPRSLALYQCSRDLATPSMPKPDYMLRLHLNKTPAQHEVNYGGGWLRRMPDSFVLAPPQIDSRVRGNCHNHFTSLILVFPEIELRQVAGDLLDSEGGDLRRAPAKELHDPFIPVLMRQLWSSAQSASPAESILIEGTFISLVGRLLLLGEQKRLAFPKYESSASLITDKALRFMRDRLGDKITLSEIATAAGVSRSYLTKVFAQATGKSVHARLIELRIERAKELLERFGRNMTLDDIATTCGFWDGTHLTRTFVQHVGVTPQVYREQS
ncbi:MAG: hypothetical protein C0478_17785 [Planctomyces sp.]|nr:hypothetical protein [Planctomyces sp.]